MMFITGVIFIIAMFLVDILLGLVMMCVSGMMFVTGVMFVIAMFVVGILLGVVMMCVS